MYLCYQAGVMRMGCRQRPPIQSSTGLDGGWGALQSFLSRLFFPFFVFRRARPRKRRVHRVRKSTPQLPEALLRNPNYPARDAEGGGWRPIKNKSGPPPSCLPTFQYWPEGTKNVSTAPLPNAPTWKGGFMEGLEGWRLDHHALRRLEVIWRKFVNK